MGPQNLPEGLMPYVVLYKHVRHLEVFLVSHSRVYCRLKAGLLVLRLVFVVILADPAIAVLTPGHLSGLRFDLEV